MTINPAFSLGVSVTFNSLSLNY